MFDKPLRLIELFAGYGSQALALKYLGIPFEHHFVCEFDKYAIQSYNEIHGTDFEVSDVTQITANDMNITETDKYKYLLTYSFPCTDLSCAGKQMGMQRNSGTRSSLLWEVERLLKECVELPQYLLMENVPQVIGKSNINLFGEWIDTLKGLGYESHCEILNSKDYGIPQNRERCFMVSILRTENKKFSFPDPIKPSLRLSDLIERDVDDEEFKSQERTEKILKGLVTKDQLLHSCTNEECLRFLRVWNSTELFDNKVMEDAGTLLAWNNAYIAIVKNGMCKVRSLTARERFRLMGVKDEDSIKVTASNTQKIKQTGNSIVVNVLMAIFENMFVKDCVDDSLF